MKNATLIKPDGTRTPVSPAKGEVFKLQELQEMVGGYIQLVFWGEMIAVINEDGKSMGLPPNPTATMLGAGFLLPGDYVVGDVVLAPRDMID